MGEEELEFQRAISAPAAEVYRAFTRATPMRDWLCDAALVDGRVGGRIYLWWNSGYYTAGEFTALEQDRGIAFSWRGKGEPGGTQVSVHISPGQGGTLVTLAHGGLGDAEPWTAIRSEFAQGWRSSLENLQSLLETGQDLRYTRRPMLGINLGDFNHEIAASLGVPVAHGIRLGGVVEGLGAAAAGLRQDDVLISIGGKPTGAWPELVAALQRRKAGDTVEVIFYRGSQEHRTTMTLSPRALPEVPATPRALAKDLHELNGKALRTLEAMLRGMSDARAAARPAPNEWGAMEVMAHMVISERENQSWLTDMINDDERWSDGFENPSNVPARVAAVVTVNPTLQSMLDELKCSLAETEAIVEGLPDKLVAHKGNYWRIGHNLLLGEEHWNEHLNQIEAALGSGPDRGPA